MIWILGELILLAGLIAMISRLDSAGAKENHYALTLTSDISAVLTKASRYARSKE